jgi:hypothetical protein
MLHAPKTCLKSSLETQPAPESRRPPKRRDKRRTTYAGVFRAALNTFQNPWRFRVKLDSGKVAGNVVVHGGNGNAGR